VGLNKAVGLFAQHSRFGEVEEELAGEDKSAGRFEILLHALGVNQQTVNQVGGLGEKVVDENGRVGEIMRSTDECEMSRSCQRAMSSKAACALPRMTRARPLICSAGDGFLFVRHGGGTFCFSLKYSLRFGELRWR